MTNKLTDEFAEELHELLENTKKEVYEPTEFLRMVDRHGAVCATKGILEPEPEYYDFAEIYNSGKLYLLVENLVIKEKYAGLFDDDEKETAEFRLKHPKEFS